MNAPRGMRVGGAMAQPAARVRCWSYVASDGKRSVFCYPSARAAALAAYWDNFGTALDITQYMEAEAIDLAEAHGFHIEQDP